MTRLCSYFQFKWASIILVILLLRPLNVVALVHTLNNQVVISVSTAAILVVSLGTTSQLNLIRKLPLNIKNHLMIFLKFILTYTKKPSNILWRHRPYQKISRGLPGKTPVAPRRLIVFAAYYLLLQMLALGLKVAHSLYLTCYFTLNLKIFPSYKNLVRQR